ncbi:small ribosomal subunit protein eS19-like [Artemia franciscana]|uniref:40S ribosomal protein S19 n=1 Tax=Artemia franciscana TaxID=6661 RepID=A0AA88KZ42_ARTSF|nr:hypothetical protein QYM36_015194 [Artemia franciscana]
MATTVMTTSVKDVNQHEFVKALAAFLKKSGKLKAPEWSDLVKTAVYKEYAPFNKDWFYIRCASIARHAYIKSPVGVGQIRRIYGGHKNNGVSPSHFCKSSGNVARKVLQALESVKILEKDPNSGGRRLTSQGQRDLDRIASQMKIVAA